MILRLSSQPSALGVTSALNFIDKSGLEF